MLQTYLLRLPGTATFSRSKPLSSTCGIGVPALDNEGRVITTVSAYQCFTCDDMHAICSGGLPADHHQDGAEGTCAAVGCALPVPVHNTKCLLLLDRDSACIGACCLQELDSLFVVNVVSGPDTSSYESLGWIAWAGHAAGDGPPAP